ncbi:hypothetical protein HG531_000062 [Fusarium graminearum]|nr:hypothetical protein HG531_000062 [Fusarium graminearum]
MKFNERTGYGTLPHMSRETEKALLADLVSIHPSIDREANFQNVVSQLTQVSSYISNMLIRPKGDNTTIRIEECYYDEKDPDGKLVLRQGILALASWRKTSNAASVELTRRRQSIQKSISFTFYYDLPHWMDCEILEITACEAMKSDWHQPFNRYAWMVEYELSKSEMSYHGDYMVMLGHDFYKTNADVLVEVARRLCNPESNIWKFRTINAAEYYLRLDDENFARRMLKIIRPAINMIREEMKPGDRRDRELVDRIYRLRKSVKARQLIED